MGQSRSRVDSMESKFFSSPSKVGQTKRSLSDDLQESPTAKRAKRVKNNKKRLSKGVKDSESYVLQQDWASTDNSRATVLSSPNNARKETPVQPPTPVPFKQAHSVYGLKSAEMMDSEYSQNKTNQIEGKTENDPKESAKKRSDLEVPKTEANTRKARGGAEPKGEAMKPLKSGDNIPVVAGPSKSSVAKDLFSEPRELTPVSDIAPPADHTFKAFPNPTPTKFPLSTKSEESKKSAEPKKNVYNVIQETSEVKKVKDAKATEQDNVVTEAKEPKKAKKDKKTKNASSPIKATTKTKETSITNQPISAAPNGTTPKERAVSPIPATLQTAPAGTKTLKAINKHLKALSASVAAAAHPGSDHEDPDLRQEISSLRASVTHLQARVERDALRASLRHEMLSNALVKVSGDVCALVGEVQRQREDLLLRRQQQQQQPDVQNGDLNGGETTTDGGGGGGGGGGVSVTANGTPRKKDTANTTANNTNPASSNNNSNTASAAVKDRNKNKSSMQQARKTLEQCLRIYSEDMERAATREEVAKYGGLMVQYAGDLFKTLG